LSAPSRKLKRSLTWTRLHRGGGRECSCTTASSARASCCPRCRRRGLRPAHRAGVIWQHGKGAERLFGRDPRMRSDIAGSMAARSSQESSRPRSGGTEQVVVVQDPECVDVLLQLPECVFDLGGVGRVADFLLDYRDLLAPCELCLAGTKAAWQDATPRRLVRSGCGSACADWSRRYQRNLVTDTVAPLSCRRAPSRNEVITITAEEGLVRRVR